MSKKILTPLQAIRAKCLDCCCRSKKEVKLCTIPDCPLYPYRFGHSPHRSHTRTPKQVAASKKAGELLAKRAINKN